VLLNALGPIRFPSVLLQPLGHLSVLESATCVRSGFDYRKTLLQILLFRDAICIQRFTDGADSIVMEIVSDLLMSFDHLRRWRTRGSVFTDEAMEPAVPLRGMEL
jgi:hypothetical protein